MNEFPPKPKFIQDQQLSHLVLLPNDDGDKRKHLRTQHGGEAWESREEFEKLATEQRRDSRRWQAVGHRSEIFSHFQSKGRVLLAVTAYAGIGKSMVLHQFDGQLSSACEGMDVVRVEFSELPDDWEQYIHKPWKGDNPFLVRILSDEFVKLRERGHQLPAIDLVDLRQLVEAKIRTGKFVLAIDGLDEYNASDAADKARHLRHLLFAVFPKLHCVVAGRPHAITQELWLPLFSESPETTKNSPRSDWEFMRVEMFDREQIERFLGKEKAIQIKMLEAEIEFSARNSESLRTLDATTLASIRSTADLYWHSIVRSLPRDNREGMGEKLVHTNLSVDEILLMLSAIGITMSLWNQDPRFPAKRDVGSDEFGTNVPIPNKESATEKDQNQHTNPGVIEIGGASTPLMTEFRRRVFERLLEVYPNWRHVEPISQRQLVELRFDELVRLNAQYVEFGFFVERGANHVRWRNATLRDYFAALWMSTRANAGERDALHQWMDVARDHRDTSIAMTWQLICGMPSEIRRLCDGADESAQNRPWLRMIHPLYKTAEDENRFSGRPTELMYRAWAGLLIRAGFLRKLDWTEYELLVATNRAQRFFDPKGETAGERIEVSDENAWKIVGIFLGQYPSLRDGNDKRSRIIKKDLESKWCDCDSYPGMKVRVGHANDTANVEREEILPHAFSISAYQVTNRLYELFDSMHQKRFNDYKRYSPKRRSAAIHLNWYDAMMFSIWCHGYLPSDWEWEYASRAECRTAEGRNATYYWGDDKGLLTKNARVRKNRQSRVYAVGRRKRNAFGLYDTLGNAWEWCRNQYDERSAWGESSPQTGFSFGHRVLRGGLFGNAAVASCSGRIVGVQWIKSHSYGLRVSRARVP